MTLHIFKNITARRKYCDEKKESLVSNKKERKEYNKISKVCMRLFDECFICFSYSLYNKLLFY